MGILCLGIQGKLIKNWQVLLYVSDVEGTCLQLGKILTQTALPALPSRCKPTKTKCKHSKLPKDIQDVRREMCNVFD